MEKNTRQTIRRHVAAAGYSADSIARGLDYAAAQGATGAREGYVLAMSRILFDDAQLAQGERFAVETGCGPRG